MEIHKIKLKKIVSFVNLFLISLLSLYLSYMLVYFVGEKFFFDKLFYYKSIDHGYWLPDNKTHLYEEYGSRSRDLVKLNPFSTEVSKNFPKVTTDQKYYKIAVIGDSFSWGQGVKTKETYPYLLEKKLNKIFPTKVFNFSNCGDNFFDNYKKYITSKDVFGDMDLYIFGMFNNDLLFNNRPEYQTLKYFDKDYNECNGIDITDKKFNPLGTNNYSYDELVRMSLTQNTKNYCLYKKLVKILPKNSTIYFNLGTLTDNSDNETNFLKLVSQDLNVLTIKNYNFNNRYWVSQKEHHPSIEAHKIFADTLFKEIISNPKWKFIK